MAQSDIVSLHLPSNPQTKGMISRAMLQKMKPTAILINVARGAVVDNTALAEALNQEKIAGAGIDVFDMEPPLPETYPLLRAKHTVLTPHVAFATEESMLRRAEIVFRNVEAYLDGCPENVCPFDGRRRRRNSLCTLRNGDKGSFYMLHYSGRGEKLSGQSSRTLA